MTGVPFAGPRHAFADEPPNSLGLPGLSLTNVLPTRRSAPLSVGVQYGYGNYDPEGGIAADFNRPDLRSQDIRLQIQLRAGSGIRMAAGVPLRILSYEGGETVTGFGDIQGSLAIRVLQTGRNGLGLWGSLTVPSGEESKGLTTGNIDGELGLMTQTRFFGGGYAPRTDLVFNIGYRFNKNERDGYGWRDAPPSEAGGFFPIYPRVLDGRKTTQNDQLLLRAALQFRQRWGAIFLEWSADWFHLNDGIGFSESPSWFTPGVIFGDASGPSLRASWSIGFAEDNPFTEFEPRVPDWYAQVAVTMPLYFGGRDRDDDLVKDKDDACPDVPEDVDGFEDEDGCPDEDNDGDGVPDVVDAAPNLMEDFDEFQDADGRPDLDNDFDGIPDTEDQCPNQPEDFDGDRDLDGCPDLVTDGDGDGIPDTEDACPDEPEDVDGFEDEDGCPDPDNDLDGILDEDDACPHDAEDYDGDRDEDGCPDTDDQDS
jgi:hypothetical protein